MKNKKIKTTFIDYLQIITGTAITSFGISVFMNRASLAPGGVSGIATTVYHVILSVAGKSVELGLIILAISIPIYILGVIFFGKEYGFKTLLGTLLISLFTLLFDHLLPNGLIDYTKDSSLWICALFTGLTGGVGIGLVVRSGSNTGGTDIIAQIISKYTHLSMGISLTLVDSCVVIASIFVFGIENALYSTITILLTSLILDRVVVSFGTNYAKTVYIISPKIDEIGEYILNELNRSGTILDAKGLFTKEHKDMLMTIIPKSSITKLVRCVKDLDKDAFMVIQDTYHVLGEGYLPLEKLAETKDVTQK